MFKFSAQYNTPDGYDIDNNNLVNFQSVWPAFWFTIITGSNTFQSFQVTGDSQPGFHITDVNNYHVDICYQVGTNNFDPVRSVYEPLQWDNRDGGTNLLTTTRVPDNFVLPDAEPGNTPNNPLTILNVQTKEVFCLNGAARPTIGGPIWGYILNPIATHGGSGILGGEVTASEIDAGLINHALAINVWGEKYLSNTGGGFVSPAVKADTGYDDSESSNYYGGNVANLKMGSRVGIPPSVTAASLGVTSTIGITVFNALKKYGAYIVDNTSWDAIAINATTKATPFLNSIKSEQASMFGALQIVL